MMEQKQHHLNQRFHQTKLKVKPLKERVKDLEENFKDLKQKVDRFDGDQMKELEFVVTSAAKEVVMFFENSYQSSGVLSEKVKLTERCKQIELDLKKYHHILDEFDDFPDSDDCPEKCKGIAEEKTNKAISSEGKDEQISGILQDKDVMTESSATRLYDDEYYDDAYEEKGDETQTEMPLRMPVTNFPMRSKRREDMVLNEETFVPSSNDDEKESCCEKLSSNSVYVKMAALRRDFEIYKEKKAQKNRNILANYHAKLLKIETDVTILCEIYGLVYTEPKIALDVEEKLKELERKVLKTKKYFHDHAEKETS